VVGDRLVQAVMSGADPGGDARLPGDVQGDFRVIQAPGGVVGECSPILPGRSAG